MAATPQQVEALVAAIEIGDVAALTAYITSGGSLHVRDAGMEWTLLMHAIVHSQVEAVRSLLHAGAPLDAADYGGHTALMFASEEPNQNYGIIRMLLDASASATATAKDGGTALTHVLYHCAYERSLEVASMLIAAGASVNVRTDIATALSIACEQGSEGHVRMLLDARADVNLAPRHSASTALEAAVGRTEFNGDPPAARHDLAVVLTQLLLDAGASVDEDAWLYTTPLHEACGPTTKLLVDAGAPIEKHNSRGQTPLHWCCTVAGDAEHCAALLDAGADPNAITLGTHGQFCFTPLHLAARNDSLKNVQRLLAYGAHRSYPIFPNASAAFPDVMHSATVPSAAAPDGRTATLEWLELTTEWTTPLHYLEFASAARVTALLREGADVHACAASGGPTPLDCAHELLGRPIQQSTASGRAAAELVVAASRPWSQETHRLFPTASRRRVFEVLCFFAHVRAREPHHPVWDSDPLSAMRLLPLIIRRADDS